MKLRITHNSIRIRIRKSELEKLQQRNTIEESVAFPNDAAFNFVLRIDNSANHLNAKLENSSLILTISPKEAEQWIGSNQVGIETNIPLDKNEQLHLLVEKDFPCLDRPEENKSDTFWELAPETPDPC